MLSYAITMLIVSLSGFLPVLPMMVLLHVILRKKDKETNIKTKMSHILAVYLFAYVLVAILSVTSIPSIYHFSIDPIINLVPFIDITTNFHQYALNVLLFVPVGFLLPMLWERFQKKHVTFLCGFLLSLFIEILQLFNNRVTDIDDLLMNTAGTIVGYFLWMLVKKRFSKITVFTLRHAKHWEWESYFCIGFVWLSMLFMQPLIFNGLFGITPKII